MKRVAFVTGGTRGIGAAIACHLKSEGYVVGVSYQGNTDAANQFTDRTNIPTYKWDASKFQDCLKGFAKVASEIGPPDILINNAGITRDSMFHKMTVEQWQDVINTNLNSCFNITRCVIESMRSKSFGRIISISSVNGQKGQAGQTNYCAAKAGILGFTKALAQENAQKNITVNAIAPGYINTEMVQAIPDAIREKIINQIPTGRLGTPLEVAHMVSYLASDNASFITGATFSINGGQYFA